LYRLRYPSFRTRRWREVWRCCRRSGWKD